MDTFMCYGPVVPDGYGVCYNPRPNNMIVCISAFKETPATQSDYFANTLEGSLLQMQELCTKTKGDFDNISEKLRNTSVRNCPAGHVNNNDTAGHKAIARPKQAGSSYVKTNGEVKNGL